MLRNCDAARFDDWVKVKEKGWGACSVGKEHLRPHAPPTMLYLPLAAAVACGGYVPYIPEPTGTSQAAPEHIRALNWALGQHQSGLAIHVWIETALCQCCPVNAHLLPD